jgi:heme-degrading monooxygenase HmoA
MARLVETPKPPYYAVIITTIRTKVEEGYEAAADRMYALACEQEGFLGMEYVRDREGVGITVSFWRDLEAVRRWKQHAEHLLVQRQGQARWYEAYRIRVSKVERETVWEAAQGVTVDLPKPNEA